MNGTSGRSHPAGIDPPLGVALLFQAPLVVACIPKPSLLWPCIPRPLLHCGLHQKLRKQASWSAIAFIQQPTQYNTFALQEEDITRPDSRDMVLLILYLYQTLPQLVPRTTLDFAGKLGDKQVSCSSPQPGQPVFGRSFLGENGRILLHRYNKISLKSL